MVHWYGLMMDPLTQWAGEAPTSGDSIDFSNPLTWVNFGVLGLLVLGFITRKIVTKGELDEEKEDVQRLRADLVKLRDEQVAEVARIRAERDGFTQQMREERDKAQHKVDAMADIYQTSLLPSLNKFLTTIEILMPLLQRVVDRPGGDQR